MERCRIPFLAGLRVLVVLMLLVHQTCSAKDSHGCAPSSCGNIHDISNPFRLEGDPKDCGDPRYGLSCENNQTVLYLFDGKYYVQEINYSDYTIRLLDSGIQEDRYFSIPRYFLDYANFSSSNLPYVTYSKHFEYKSTREGETDSPRLLSDIVVFVSCEKPVNSYYWDISTCFKHGVMYSANSFLSHPHIRYMSSPEKYLFTLPTVDYLEDLCQVDQMSLTSGQPQYSIKNISCTYVHNVLRYGFKLSWHIFHCGSCGRRYDYCYLDDANNASCQSNKAPGFGFLARLEGIIRDITHTIAPRRLTPRFREKRFEVYDKDPPIGLLRVLGIYVSFFHGGTIILGIPFVIALLIYKWQRRHLSMYDGVEEFLQSHNNLMPIRYSYSEIRHMTKSFKEKLGEGGYGTVFKGTLRSGRLVAVKMLGKSRANGQEFINEVASIGRIHHVNVVQLIGFCVEGSKRALLYEFMPKGSLNKYIFSQEESILLNYDTMHNIALGVARGIEYLHRGCDMQILHFDIKPHNILLDETFTPKVSDFGLAKLYPVDDSIVSLTAVRGTLGYMAPELFYKNIGGISYKADVYSFGMLLMEMAVRRRNTNASAEHSSQIYFPTWVYDQLHNGKDLEIEDATVEEKQISKKMIMVALWCIQMKPSDRPSMNKVVEMLEGEVECLQMPNKPFLSSSSERQIEYIGYSSNQTWSSTQSGEVSQPTES